MAPRLSRSRRPRPQRLPEELRYREARIDPRGAGPHSTLPYREATELLRCIQIMGPDAEAACREEVLGIPVGPGPAAAAAPAAPPPLATQAIAGTSSPVPASAQALPAGGHRTTINNVEVTVLPDLASADPAMANRARTALASSWSGLAYTTDAQGVVTSFTPAALRVTIQTTYGPGVTAASPSGYGRGTTAADVAAGDTSLGFHESRHGDDFLQAMHRTPPPAFAGSAGQSEADFLAARAAFGAAATQYFATIEQDSHRATDCVGTTIDQFNAQQGVITTECAAPAPGGGTP